MEIFRFLSSFNSTVWMLPQDRVELNKQRFFEYSRPESIIEVRNFMNSIEVNDGSNEQTSYTIVNRKMIFPLIGEFAPRVDGFMEWIGFIGTIQKMQELSEAVEKERNSIDQLILYIDSPGGVSIGIPEFARTVRNIAESGLEVIAFSDIKMASAAYYIASAANKIITTPSTLVGSIGVIMEAIKINNNDRKTYLFTAGDLKSAGHPNKELDIKEFEFFSEFVQKSYDKFVMDVSNYRGVPEQEVRDTNAATVQSFMSEWFVDGLVNSLYELI